MIEPLDGRSAADGQSSSVGSGAEPEEARRPAGSRRTERHGEDLGLVSLVVPAYNERDNIRPLLEAIEEGMQGVDPYEIVMVDDGSSDGTLDMLRGEMEHRARLRVVTLDRNHGQTAAFHAGFHAARGEVIVTMDADLQNDPHDIPRLLAALEGADAVVGYRQVRRDSFVKRVSSRIANGVRNGITRESIRDVGCSLKAFRAEPLRAIALFEGMHRFFPTLLRMHGHTVVEVPVSHHPRCHGTSKYGIRNRVLRSLLDCLAVRWMQWRLLRYRATEASRAEQRDRRPEQDGSEGPSTGEAAAGHPANRGEGTRSTRPATQRSAERPAE